MVLSGSFRAHRGIESLTPRCELVAGRSIKVIQAGQGVDVGRSRTHEGDAAAAVCCCLTCRAATAVQQCPSVARRYVCSIGCDPLLKRSFREGQPARAQLRGRRLPAPRHCCGPGSRPVPPAAAAAPGWPCRRARASQAPAPRAGRATARRPAGERCSVKGRCPLSSAEFLLRQ